jgi:hypothetical protein
VNLTRVRGLPVSSLFRVWGGQGRPGPLQHIGNSAPQSSKEHKKSWPSKERGEGVSRKVKEMMEWVGDRKSGQLGKPCERLTGSWCG